VINPAFGLPYVWIKQPSEVAVRVALWICNAAVPMYAIAYSTGEDMCEKESEFQHIDIQSLENTGHQFLRSLGPVSCQGGCCSLPDLRHHQAGGDSRPQIELEKHP
jgi:hypothetical protein